MQSYGIFPGPQAGTPPCTHQHPCKLLGRSQPGMPHKPLSPPLLNHTDSSPEGPGQCSSLQKTPATMHNPAAAPCPNPNPLPSIWTITMPEHVTFM